MQLRLMKLLPVVAALIVASPASAGTKPLKVYLLVGQSNMQGQANVRTLPHMTMDLASKALHDKIVDSDGKPRVYEDVHITYLSGGRSGPNIKTGPLTVGFGSDGSKPDVLGPELGFGITIHEKLRQPILIIKTAWGGKSINTDFRSPSAGPYPFSEQQIASAKTRHKLTLEQLKAQKAEKTGHYYRLMAAHVKKVLANPGK
ncbi:MAG: sialate O-acetylesterase, partial [Planctomycetota bacterium]